MKKKSKSKFGKKRTPITYVGKTAIIKDSVKLSEQMVQKHNHPYKIIKEHLGKAGSSILLETKVHSFSWCNGEYKFDIVDKSFWMNLNDCKIT